MSVSLREVREEERPRSVTPSGVRLAVPHPAREESACLHCGAPLLLATGDFCCEGCALVHELLGREGLDRYYDLRGPTGTPVTTTRAPDTAWLAPMEATLLGAPGVVRLVLDVQGVHCSACVWLLEQLFHRYPGALSIVLNPAIGRIEIAADARFPLAEFVREAARFGYLLGPAQKDDRAPSSDLLTRLGVCAAIAMNAMLFSIAFYAGLSSGPIFRLFSALTFVLGLASVFVGGSVFFRSAWQGLVRGVLHLDLPIALGIGLAFAGSTYSYARLGGHAVFFDTLTVFIALMLAGRFLQERVLEANRRRLLASDGAEGLLTRRLEAEGARVVRCVEVRRGDRLLLAPGELLPVDATLDDDDAQVSLEWIRGESEPRRFERGANVPAGACLASRSAVVVTAASDFADSPVVDLVRTPRARASEAARSTPFWRTLSRVYVVGVLAAALGGFALWAFAFHDFVRAVEVATAVLVVTCPCAFGIATPLAHELAYAGLRRAGLFVQTAGFLDRAPAVKRVVFDKTGTLTTGELRVHDPEALLTLPPAARGALFQMTARSSHPKSAAVHRALFGVATFDPSARVVEHPGSGLSLGAYRFGAARWAAPSSPSDGDALVLAERGRVLATVTFGEELRPDAAREVLALTFAGYEVFVLSGDAETKVQTLAREVGVPASRALGEKSPKEKAEVLAALDHEDTLFLGDGINDGPAAERAYLSGTPAVDRPFLPARTDFYFVTPGLAPIGLALRASRAVARITRRNLGAAVAYNAVAVGLAYAGLMSPLVAAVFMPLSSISIVSATVWSLAARSPLWRS